MKGRGGRRRVGRKFSTPWKSFFHGWGKRDFETLGRVRGVTRRVIGVSPTADLVQPATQGGGSSEEDDMRAPEAFHKCRVMKGGGRSEREVFESARSGAGWRAMRERGGVVRLGAGGGEDRSISVPPGSPKVGFVAKHGAVRRGRDDPGAAAETGNSAQGLEHGGVREGVRQVDEQAGDRGGRGFRRRPSVPAQGPNATLPAGWS